MQRFLKLILKVMLKTEPISNIMHFDAPLRFVDDCQTFLHETMTI